ncbi:hypothetical protein NU09_2034 [Flavobacterium beibuense]|uniref:Uncharacterized protein n=1 Tax=Flavobacterium beibuense TaxID=657326 RepID=A0A444WAV0_9FLAO|nr:hypothetical protein NU09_2034 [Flavobacterium beibuense]
MEGFFILYPFINYCLMAVFLMKLSIFTAFNQKSVKEKKLIKGI